MSTKELVGRDELADMLKGGGLALGGVTLFQVLWNRDNGEYFSTGKCGGVSAFTMFNELLFLWFYNRIFKNNKALTGTLRRQLLGRLVIFGAVIFYSTPLFVGRDTKKWIYAAIFAMKLAVGSPFLMSFKWRTAEEATAFLNFTMAVSYGVITYQLFQK